MLAKLLGMQNSALLAQAQTDITALDSGKADIPATVAIKTGDTIALADNTEYTGADIVTLTFTMAGTPKCRLTFTTAAAGTIAIAFPAGTRYQNATAPNIGTGEYWEIVFDGLNCNYTKYGEEA